MKKEWLKHRYKLDKTIVWLYVPFCISGICSIMLRVADGEYMTAAQFGGMLVIIGMYAVDAWREMKIIKSMLEEA